MGKPIYELTEDLLTVSLVGFRDPENLLSINVGCIWTWISENENTHGLQGETGTRGMTSLLLAKKKLRHFELRDSTFGNISAQSTSARERRCIQVGINLRLS